jgi:hypothetical protein
MEPWIVEILTTEYLDAKDSCRLGLTCKGYKRVLDKLREKRFQKVYFINHTTKEFLITNKLFLPYIEEFLCDPAKSVLSHSWKKDHIEAKDIPLTKEKEKGNKDFKRILWDYTFPFALD